MPDRSARRDDDAVRRFVERMAMMWADWGFPRMAARVLMTMMSADEEELTAGELGERLGVSPAAISGAVRYLMKIGVLVREPVPGSRRDSYRLPDDAWYESSAAQLELYRVIADLSDEAVPALGGTDTPSGARAAEMRDFFLFFQREMPPLLERWREYKGAARSLPERAGEAGDGRYDADQKVRG